jgi:hypothetical protein
MVLLEAFEEVEFNLERGGVDGVVVGKSHGE